jgi:hypothetical protein
MRTRNRNTAIEPELRTRISKLPSSCELLDPDLDPGAKMNPDPDSGFEDQKFKNVQFILRPL